MSERANRERRVVEAQDMLDNAPSTGKRGTYLKLPEGIKFFQPEKNRVYRLMFFPWPAGKRNVGETIKKGQFVTNRFVFVHKQIGPNDETFTCMAKSFGKECAVCNGFNTLRATSVDWDKIKGLKFKNREMFLIHELGGPKNNIQVWEESTVAFGDYLRGRLEGRASYKRFASPEGGLVLEVKGKAKKIEKNEFIEFFQIEFTPREEDEQEIFDKLFEKIEKNKICPDEWLIEPAQDKLAKLFSQTGGVKKAKPDDSDDDDDQDDSELETEEDEIEEEETPPKKTTKKKPAEDDEDTETDDSDDDDSDPDDSELEEDSETETDDSDDDDSDPDDSELEEDSETETDDSDDDDSDPDDSELEEEEESPPPKKTTTKKKPSK
jgi:hypothetical protein